MQDLQAKPGLAEQADLQAVALVLVACGANWPTGSDAWAACSMLDLACLIGLSEVVALTLFLELEHLRT